MSRVMRRVPMDFAWPLNKVWGGFINPYVQLAADCPDCVDGCDLVKGRRDANAALFHAQWYGNTVPGGPLFDPVAYGVDPISPDAPGIWAIARRNVDAAPDFYMTSTERLARAHFRWKAIVQGFDDQDPPLVPVPSFDKDAAIAREARRLYEECFRHHWSHHLSQADVDALIAKDRLWCFTRVPRCNEHWLVVAINQVFHHQNSWLPESNGYRPSAAEVNEWSIGGFGHDASNAFSCVEARCLREGVPFQCLRCAGTARLWPSLEVKRRCETWERTDPPTGDGFQLWETTSEGSPVSPVFASMDDLCAWCEGHANTFADFRATKEEWRQMLDDGHVYATDERGNIYT